MGGEEGGMDDVGGANTGKVVANMISEPAKAEDQQEKHRAESEVKVQRCHGVACGVFIEGGEEKYKSALLLSSLEDKAARNIIGLESKYG